MSGATAISPWTVVVTAPAGQEISRSVLRPGVPVTIGRAPDSTIMLGAMKIARNQGRIELVNGMPTYFEGDGASGSLVDGDPVEKSALLGERTMLEIGGFRFTLLRQRAAAPAAAAKPADAAPALSESVQTLLDRHIQGVRLHRTEAQKEVEGRAQKWEQDWRKVVESAREIKARYGQHPQILDFAISKDEREVIVKLREASPRGYAYFCLSRAHPEGRYPDMQAVWLREVGREDCNYEQPMRGLEELISRLAPRLA